MVQRDMAPRRILAMRTPFDDTVFEAFAERHGVTVDMAPANVRTAGWDGNPKGPRRGLPTEFPRFVFTPCGQGIGAVLVLYLHYRDDEPLVRYGHSSGGTWVHVDTDILPATMVCSDLVGRAIRDLVDVPGVIGWTIGEVTEENGTVTMKLKPPRAVSKRKDAA
jgi:hypothetical protein